MAARHACAVSARDWARPRPARISGSRWSIREFRSQPPRCSVRDRGIFGAGRTAGPWSSAGDGVAACGCATIWNLRRWRCARQSEPCLPDAGAARVPACAHERLGSDVLRAVPDRRSGPESCAISSGARGGGAGAVSLRNRTCSPQMFELVLHNRTDVPGVMSAEPAPAGSGSADRGCFGFAKRKMDSRCRFRGHKPRANDVRGASLSAGWYNAALDLRKGASDGRPLSITRTDHCKPA